MTEATKISADEVQAGYSVRLAASKRFERIERVEVDDLDRIVLHVSYGSCALWPDEQVEIEAVTGLSVPPYLRVIAEGDQMKEAHEVAEVEAMATHADTFGNLNEFDGVKCQ